MEKKKIFIVDYSKTFREMLTTSIDSDNYVIEGVKTADLALLRIINWNPDLLITAVEVGNISGFDLCLILKMIPDLAGIPIILYSSHPKEKMLDKAIDVGADLYVQKNSEVIVNIKKGIDLLLRRSPQETLHPAAKRTINRVMIVDDSGFMRKIIKNILVSLGIETVVEAGDGREGLKMLEQHQVEMIITDWNMPVMNGLEMIKQIRTCPAYDDIAIAMVTAEAAEDKNQVLQAGANGFLHKPFNSLEMKELIAKFAANAAP